MSNLLKYALVAFAVALPAAPAAAVTIDFENLAAGTVLSNQYAGVTFSPNAFSGPNVNSTTQGWATNTGMTIVSSTGSDVGVLGTPALVSGNILRSFNQWLSEDGDPSFNMAFAAPINSISVTFAGVATPSDVMLYIFNGATQIGLVAGAGAGTTTTQFALTFSAPSITRVAVAPGSFNDWVGVDNIVYTLAATPAIPEPATWAMMIGGFGLVGCAMRRRVNRVAYAVA